jgi:hypothetical protein
LRLAEAGDEGVEAVEQCARGAALGEGGVEEGRWRK